MRPTTTHPPRHPKTQLAPARVPPHLHQRLLPQPAHLAVRILPASHVCLARLLDAWKFIALCSCVYTSACMSV